MKLNGPFIFDVKFVNIDLRNFFFSFLIKTGFI